MREYSINAKNIKNPIYRAPVKMGGYDGEGRELAITNYYLTLDGRPFFAVCGEAHFSRMDPELWEDEIIKMKQGGLNIIASYIFWIHHEEEEGKFEWTGRKNLRRFLELCKKNHMFVILRIGPFSHGECRNGGFPDWLFGRPFDIRCNDPEYLRYTKRFYREIYCQAEGLLFKDNGPVIGVQLENEHEHASCPWEMTTENSKEWVVSGRQGREHMATLKKLAMEVGFDVPLYTGTAWGGACAPEDVVLPLWGGYAFRPWMFYDGKLKEHPATAEYLYGDFHCNSAPKYYNFDPEYQPEDFPYACCEMGGGMNVYYPYRFQLPLESVGALAQVKAGSGCNFLGYYMYHGGTHPTGKKIPWLNECAVPKFSYDYQAPLGEFGQVRESYHGLKMQHLFYREFAEAFTATKTVLSEEAVNQTPEDVETLRYVVRADEKGRGFLFLNNYQDHVEGRDQKEFAVNVETDQGALRIPEDGHLDLAKGSCAILPFWFEMKGNVLRYASAQPVTRVRGEEKDCYVFAAVKGMRTEFVFHKAGSLKALAGCRAEGDKVTVKEGAYASFEVADENGIVSTVAVIPWDAAFKLWQIDMGECGADEEEAGRKLILSDCPILYKNNRLELEYHCGEPVSLGIFPTDKEEIRIGGAVYRACGMDGIFKRFEKYEEQRIFHYTAEDRSTVNTGEEGGLKRPVVGSPVSSSKVVNARMVLNFTPEDFEGVKQLILKVSYEGDIGYAFINGEMIHDNFCNGAPWEMDLYPYREKLLQYGMYLYISPKKSGAYVDNSSAMAARFEVVKEQVAKIHSVSLEAVKRVAVDIF